jgi:hypothetical protein
MMRVFTLLLWSGAIVHTSTSQVFISQIGDTVRIDHINISSHCGTEFIVTATLSGDTVTILERDTSTSIPPPCLCVYALRSNIVGLSAGTYTAVINRVVTVFRPDQSSTDTTITLVSMVFTVTGSNLFPFSSSFYQGRCGESLSDVGTRNSDITPGIPLGNYPNPFNPETVIAFEVPMVGGQWPVVSLRVYDVLGREVAVLVDEEKQPGRYEVPFDATALSSGIYLYRLSVASTMPQAPISGSGGQMHDRSTGPERSYLQTMRMVLIR